VTAARDVGGASPGPSFTELVQDLSGRRERNLRMGGAERVEQQHVRGKLTVRERIDVLFDRGSFVEFGLLAHQQQVGSVEPDAAGTPADGVVTGYGLIAGRQAWVIAYDFTVMAGSMGAHVGEQHKTTRVRELALRNRQPIIWLLDSAGARIQEYVGSTFAASGWLFFDQVQLSGVVPQVAALMGPCAAGTAYIPGLADFVPMVKETSSMALGGARLVRAATGEEVTDHDMGGSQVHCYQSGVGDNEVPDDHACIDAVRQFLSYLPSNCEEQPPLVPTSRAPGLVMDLEDVVPANPSVAYDVRLAIARIVDQGTWFEVKPTFARNIVIGFARLGGRSAGLVANQPAVRDGALDSDACDKAARFIRMCDAFNVPLLYLIDVPGFAEEERSSRGRLIRHAAKLLYATGEATVSKVVVVTRKAQGPAYYAMSGGSKPDLLVAWPFAQIQAQEIGTPEHRGAAAADAGPYGPAGWAMIDDVISPAETRLAVIRALEESSTKVVPQPWRKHDNMPT